MRLNNNNRRLIVFIFFPLDAIEIVREQRSRGLFIIKTATWKYFNCHRIGSKDLFCWGMKTSFEWAYASFFISMTNSHFNRLNDVAIMKSIPNTYLLNNHCWWFFFMKMFQSVLLWPNIPYVYYKFAMFFFYSQMHHFQYDKAIKNIHICGWKFTKVGMFGDFQMIYYRVPY